VCRDVNTVFAVLNTAMFRLFAFAGQTLAEMHVATSGRRSNRKRMGGERVARALLNRREDPNSDPSTRKVLSMKLRNLSLLPVFCGLATGAAVLPARSAMAAYQMISAASCKSYSLGSVSPGAWFYNGIWTAVDPTNLVYCPLPYDDNIQAPNITTTYVFVNDTSPTLQATAYSCLYDAYGLTVSCGTPSTSGTSYTGTAYLTPAAPPSTYHGWASYYIQVTMPKGTSLISYYVSQ